MANKQRLCYTSGKIQSVPSEWYLYPPDKKHFALVTALDIECKYPLSVSSEVGKIRLVENVPLVHMETRVQGDRVTARPFGDNGILVCQDAQLVVTLRPLDPAITGVTAILWFLYFEIESVD